jgi:hypothetical protein
MSNVRAVLAGFLVASALILAGGWVLTMLAAPAMRGEQYAPTLATALLALLYTGAAIVVGAYVAARINDSYETSSGFMIAQAFFGSGLIREFWRTGSSWYTVAAVVLVIPCAMIARMLARRFARDRIAGTA